MRLLVWFPKPHLDGSMFKWALFMLPWWCDRVSPYIYRKFIWKLSSPKIFSAIPILPLSPFFPPTLLSILSTFWKQKSMETCHFQADLAFFNPYHTIMYLRKIIIKIFKTFLTTSHITLTHSKKESFWYHLNRVW